MRSFSVSERTLLRDFWRCDSINSYADAATIECFVNRGLAYAKAVAERMVGFFRFVKPEDVVPLSVMSVPLEAFRLRDIVALSRAQRVRSDPRRGLPRSYILY